MAYQLRFHVLALREWRNLDASIREPFKKKLAERLQEPRVPSAALHGMPDCYKIKLQRRDKIAQIASHYVSCVSGIWHSANPAERGERFAPPIYINDIDFSIDLILNNEKIFATLDAKFDQELYYEDLNLESDKWVKLNAPDNYDEICSVIKHRLQQRGLQI